MPSPMSQPPRPPSAVNPLPKAVIALAVVIFGVECLFSLSEQSLFGGSNGTRIDAIERFAFFGAGLDWMVVNLSVSPDLLVRLVSYAFIHVSFVSVMFVCVFILAMGKIVGEVLGNASVLTLFFGGTIAGALAYGVLLNEDFPLIGAWPGVYGLIGGFTFVMWVRKRAMGESAARAFQLIALLLGLQLFFDLIFGGHNEWVADLAGFASGFALSFVVVPGGWARIREALRSLGR